jgi:proteasome lid subunit RPN8/RPN11
VLGFFHSHPDHPARPSAFDLEHAWPYYSYLIVSVVDGKVAGIASWRLAADRTRFDPEPLEPMPAAVSP